MNPRNVHGATGCCPGTRPAVDGFAAPRRAATGGRMHRWAILFVRVERLRAASRHGGEPSI